jgi:hypothetical protein
MHAPRPISVIGARSVDTALVGAMVRRQDVFGVAKRVWKCLDNGCWAGLTAKSDPPRTDSGRATSRGRAFYLPQAQMICAGFAQTRVALLLSH